MPSPTLKDLHVNSVLTEMSIAYRNDAYIADRVFPLVNVDKQSDIYALYTKQDWFRDEAQRRAPGEEVKTSGWNVDTTNTYYCINYALGKDIPDEIAAGADDVFDLDRDATIFVTDKLQLRREIEWAADFFTTGVWGTDATFSATTRWNVYASSDPLSDVHDGIETVLQNTGKRPNKFVMGYQVFNELLDHPDILDRIKYGASSGNPAVTTEMALAQLFGVDEVLVARAIKTTNIEKNESPTMSFVWGQHALLLYVAPRPSRLEPSAGYTFVWNPMGGRGPQIINQRRDSARHCDVVEAIGYWDSKRTAQDCGYFFSSVTA